MNTFDESKHRRQPEGVSGGGQFASKPKAETDVTLDAPARATDRHGGFRLAKFHASGMGGAAFSAVLTENGKPVADVVQEGRGGVTDIRWHGGWRPDVAKRFEQFAAAEHGEDYEPVESLVTRLAVVAEMDRMRTVAFLADGDTADTFWRDGEYRRASGSREQGLQALVRAREAGHLRDVRVWDKDAADFIPLDEALAKA